MTTLYFWILLVTLSQPSAVVLGSYSTSTECAAAKPQILAAVQSKYPNLRVKVTCQKIAI